jgi:hypothetical protein
LLDLGCEAHQDTLMQMVHALQPELVVVDSLSSISRKGENNVEDVRAVLGFLVALAREFDVGLLLIHHLRKQGKLFRREAVTLDDFRGSGHITAMARSVLSLSVVQDGPQPDRNGPRHLEVVKTNLCAHPRPLGLVFEPAGPHAPTLRYTSPPRPYRPPTQVDACAVWLVDLLTEAGKPLKPQEVVALAGEAGFTKSAVYRARKRLAGTIADTGTRFSPHNRWVLAERKP